MNLSGCSSAAIFRNARRTSAGLAPSASPSIRRARARSSKAGSRDPADSPSVEEREDPRDEGGARNGSRAPRSPPRPAGGA